MKWLGLAGAAVVVAVASACAPDGSDVASDVASSVAAAAAATSTGTCTPLPGYSGPVTDKGVALAIGNPSTVSAADFYFQPTCVTTTESGLVTLRVTNTGAILHNVSVADQGIDIDVGPGETVEVPVDVEGAPVVYICKYHRTAGMVGAVIPVDD